MPSHNLPPMPGLNPTNCEVVAESLRNHFINQVLQREGRCRWVLSKLSGCAIGFYLPFNIGRMALTSCERITADMREICATDSRNNAGTSKIGVLPNFTSDGEAIDEGGVRVTYGAGEVEFVKSGVERRKCMSRRGICKNDSCIASYWRNVTNIEYRLSFTRTFKM